MDEVRRFPKKRANRLARYGAAAAAMFAAIQLLRIPVIGPGLGPAIFLAIGFAAWYGGVGPGVLATLVFQVSVVAGKLLHGEELATKTIADLIVILSLGVGFSVLIESLHLAWRRVEAGRQWLSATLTSIGDAVIATDARGRVVLMNPVAEALCGWPAAEAVGRPLEEVFRIVDEATRRPIESPALRVIAEGVVVGLANHTVLIARDGTERPIDDSGAPIRGAGGEVEGVVLVFRDVTERRLAEARAAEEARHKDEFLAMLAHELRNPLAAIANAARILAHPGAEDAHGWSREILERQVGQLTRLVDDLLDVSRISRGKIQLRPRRVELADAVRSAAQVVRPLVDERRHDLILSMPADPIEVVADPARLEQVIVNLLNNAAKYTEPGGRIHVEATRESGEAVLSVTDTGIGIVPEMLPRVFDLFTQGDLALSRAEGGLGIGLTMVQKLVELHDGRVEVASEGPGRGSRFTVRLPAQTVPLPTAASRPGLDGILPPGPWP